MDAPPAAAVAFVRREARAMGSPLRLQVPGPVADVAVETAWAAARDEFEACEAAMSRFRDDSELTRVNRAGGAPRVALSRRLASALAAADRARRVTDGRFDARVVEALESAGFGAVDQGTPTAGWTPIDLGGIGKGLALRWAARRAAAILGPGASFLLEAGGDVVARGGPDPDQGDEPWLAAIEDPRGGSKPLAVLGIPPDGAVATSSTRLARRVDQGGASVHHLIDPRTGRPGGLGLLAVTVAGPDPAWAEVWSKALFLEGRSRVADVARARGLAAWWVDEDGRLEMTPAARQRTAWLAREA